MAKVTRPLTRPITLPLTVVLDADEHALSEGEPDPEAPITGANLWAGGDEGAWYDPSDLTTVFQERTGASATTPSVADGVVGTILDKSGNGNHWVAPSDAARPLLKTSGGLYWLEFDGSDDGLGVSSITLAASMTAIWGVLTSDASIVSFYSENASNFFGVAQNGAGGSAPDANSGTPAYRVNNGDELSRDRDVFHDAMCIGSGVVVEARGVDLSNADYSGLKFGDYPAGFAFTGRFFGSVLALEANIGPARAEILDWMAEKSGATLP